MKTWTIKSTSDPSKQYQVTMVTEWQWECTCPDFQMRHRDCKHVKGVQKAYERKANKQTAKSEPAPDGSQTAEVPSDDRGHGQERDTVPSGELRRSDSVDGEPADIPAGNEQSGEPGHSSSSDNAETSMGTPDPEPDLPGSTQGGDTTPPGSDQGLCDESTARERLAAQKAEQLDKYEKWQLRETSHSKPLHQRLEELRVRWKNEPSNRKTIELMIKPIHSAIRQENTKDWKAKPDFDTSLIEVDIEDTTPETAELLDNIQKNLF